jgi:hypothetical protein
LKLFAAGPRPTAILWFERLGLAGIALDILQPALLFPRRIEAEGLPLAIALSLIAPALFLLLLLLASRRASNIARWLLASLVLLALAAAASAGVGAWDGDLVLPIGALAMLLEAAAVAMTFTPAGGRWFAREVADG